MEEKERYSYDYFIDGAVFIDTENDRDMDMDTVCSLLNQQNERIKELEEENQQLKDKIEFLTTFKEVISEYKPAFCKLAGRDCEWLGKEKQIKSQPAEIVEKIRKELGLKLKYKLNDEVSVLKICNKINEVLDTILKEYQK